MPYTMLMIIRMYFNNITLEKFFFNFDFLSIKDKQEF